MNYFSAFDGISCSSVALLPLGFKCIGVSEIDPFCCKLLEQKYGHKNFGDFTKWREWGKIETDLALFSPPCTAFSNLGQRRGTKDPAGQLTLETIRFICRNAPRWFAVENVPQLLHADRTRLWRHLCSTLSRRGYNLAWQVLDAQYFGVPQRRRRIFTIGHLGSSTCAAKVLFDSQTLPVFDTSSEEERQEYSRTIEEHHQRDCTGSDHSDHHRTRYKDNPRVSGTLATQIDGGAEQVNRLVIDNGRVRYLTPLECERLQGFPDGYTQGFSDTQRYKMLGNSIAVPVMKFIGTRILAVEQEAVEWSKAG